MSQIVTFRRSPRRVHPVRVIVSPEVFDATRYPDGVVQITCHPDDSDTVIVEIPATADRDDAIDLIADAFREMGRRVAARMTEEPNP